MRQAWPQERREAVANIRAIAAEDLSTLAKLGLDEATALRAMVQDMAWALTLSDQVLGAATAYLADGTFFLDGLVGEDQHRLALVDHAIAYAKWSFAPAVTVKSSAHPKLVELRGFVGIDPSGLPPELARASKDATLLMKRL